jgi:hypothetical protein
MFYEDNIVITQIIFRWSSIPGQIEIWKCWFLRRGKPEDPEKNPCGKGENQQTTQLTYSTRAEDRTHDPLDPLKSNQLLPGTSYLKLQ